MKERLFTIGEAAKLMRTTVRTLQYYDKKGLLKPSYFSNGGRRLYNAKDIIRLHQILSFKYLGFSLEQIKSKLFPLDNPQEVAIVLDNQKKIIEKQISDLTKAKQAIETLYNEVKTIQEVDFSKYAEIIELLKVENDGYWVWKCLDNSLKEHIYKRFGNDAQTALKIFDTYKEVLDKTYILKLEGESPESDISKKLAAKWWDMILEFTGGDMSLIAQLEAFNKDKKNWDHELSKKQQEIDIYLGEILKYYFDDMKG
ncbi:MAG: MerR family transcriptional regulator [Thomasclavelia sp.]|uniref:MerR family transcriptional regulator n=1 Tax=Thomasclavelia sp. TaxID=3025757 RepID=UPI0039A3E38F